MHPIDQDLIADHPIVLAHCWLVGLALAAGRPRTAERYLELVAAACSS